MKKLLTIALLLCVKTVFAQKDTVGLNIPFVDNAVVYERVYDVPKASRDLLYRNARSWFATTHPNGGITTLTMRDSVLTRTTGKVHYAIDVPYKVLWGTLTYTSTYDFTVQIDCKDDKYRIRIYNIQAVNGATPVEQLVQSLADAKTLDLGGGINRLTVADLKKRLQLMSSIVNNLLDDAHRKMTDNDNF